MFVRIPPDLERYLLRGQKFSLDKYIVRELNTFFKVLLHPLVRKLFLHLKEATLQLQ